MPASIRTATAADVSDLAALRYEFRAVRAPPVEPRTKFLRRCRSWMLRQLAPGGNWRCWLWEVDGKVEGHLWLQLIDKIPNPGAELEHHAYITNVYVRPDARGSAGTKLIRAALAWCRSHDVDMAILWPTERSRPLYRRQGFGVSRAVLAARVGATPPGRRRSTR
jgi:GNAT superfamily N-acetyltransferase